MGAKDGVKRRALRVLKQKKMYEAQQAKLMDTSFNIETQSFALENAKTNIETVNAMKEANKQLSKQFKSPALDIDAIEEIQDALSRSYGVGEDFDEADLDAELDTDPGAP